MRANELSCKDFMVGDWVIPHVYDSKLEPSKIVGIHYNSYKFKYYVDLVDCEVWDELSLSDIEPIPLTAEILEKNGFEKTQIHGEKQDDIFQCFDGEIIIEVGIYDPNFILIHYRYETPDGINSGELSSIVKVDGGKFYLHELQHALRLCGIEKEIKLED